MEEMDLTQGESLALRVSGVSLVRQRTQILDGVNWSLPRGGHAALLGPNGSGKTTLTRVIMGYEWPTQGTVEVLGERYGETDLREMRKRIALVNPSDRFGIDPNLTATQAVVTGYFSTLALFDEATAEQTEHAVYLLETVGMGHRLGHKFGVLSTGERRRVLLARALVHLPELLILDEPTAGLDVRAREHLLATIARLRGRADGPTVITVTHHVEEIAPGTEHVLLLNEGKVAAAGHPDEVISPESLSSVFGCKVYVQKRSGRFWLEVLPEAWLDLLR